MIKMTIFLRIILSSLDIDNIILHAYIAAWQEKIEKNRDWFLRDEKLSRTNENARLPESKRSRLLMELEGLQGSFRKLNID